MSDLKGKNNIEDAARPEDMEQFQFSEIYAKRMERWAEARNREHDRRAGIKADDEMTLASKPSMSKESSYISAEVPSGEIPPCEIPNGRLGALPSPKLTLNDCMPGKPGRYFNP